MNRALQYRSGVDPIEANDLAVSEPQVMAEMMAAYERYADEVNLIEVPADYHVLQQVQKNVARNQAKEVLGKVPVTIE